MLAEVCFKESATLLVLASDPPARPRTGPCLLDLALLVAGAFSCLVGLIVWFDNAQGGLTGNGIIKSLELKPWISDPAHAPLYPANYFFYPVYGALCRLLDGLDILAGDPRRQLTILNAASASLCLCVVYALVRAATGDRLVALLAALFHVCCSYVLLLAITNEDIMPSYTVMLASMALASLWFARPTATRILAVAGLFSIGWLFEWRLMFPTLPAMLAALWLCERRLALRLAWIGLFLAGMAATAAIAAGAWNGHEGAVGPIKLLWTGKGVDSAWAGFSWPKVSYLSDGMAGYLLGTAVTRYEAIPGWDIWRYAALAWMLVPAIVAARLLWPKRNEPFACAVAVIFGGTFVAGEVFNLYSQPQDPQMQINVMAWLTVGWALVLWTARKRWGGRVLAALGGATVALLAYNIWSMEPQRGADTAWRQAFETIQQKADPRRTVFLVHVFDWMVNYARLYRGPQEFGTNTLGPAPQAAPTFKWIGFALDALRHRDWSGERQAANLKHQIDRALDLGYDVLVVRLWRIDERQLEKDTNMIADSGRVEALRTMLHRDYTATPAFDDPVLGPVDRLQRVR
jgi:hypothetical protein